VSVKFVLFLKYLNSLSGIIVLVKLDYYVLIISVI